MKALFFSLSTLLILSLSLNIGMAQTNSMLKDQPKEKCTIKAKVIDEESGEGLAFASIFIEKEKKGMTTDLDGTFSLEVADCQNAVLEFSYVGFKSIKFKAKEIAKVIKMRTPTDDEWWEMIIPNKEHYVRYNLLNIDSLEPLKPEKKIPILKKKN